MKTVRYMLAVLSILFLAACGQTVTAPQTDDSAALTLTISASGEVSLSHAKGLATQRLSLPDGQRLLVPFLEYRPVHLQVVKQEDGSYDIRMAAKNITLNKQFGLPMRFARVVALNVLSSVEPTVVASDLGSDGVLSPGETSAEFSFKVTPKNLRRAVVYVVLLEANVTTLQAP